MRGVRENWGKGAVDGVRTATAVTGRATAQCGVNGSGGAARLEFAGEWRHLGSARGARGRARRLGDLGKNGRGGPGDAFYRSGRWRSWPWRAATAGGWSSGDVGEWGSNGADFWGGKVEEGEDVGWTTSARARERGGARRKRRRGVAQAAMAAVGAGGKG